MPPARFGPGQILEYNERHGVLICHECQYAIQKSALQSHLLRHKIYRADRQQLLSFISELNILEPDQVVLPTPESPPIDGLPVISGYRCTVAGCVNLCASIKRMKGHWRESHGIIDASLARPVKLQTFFRGTKISYFEVTPVDEEGYDAGSDNADHDADMEDLGQVYEPSPDSSVPSRMPLDLETLSYFHHFTSTTSLTLPSPQSTLSAAQYWQTRVVPQALSEHFLMCGLLALSACHLAAFTDNPEAEQRHRTRASEFSSEFLTGREAIATEDIKETVTHIECLLRCAHWALAESPSDERIMPEPGVPDQLQSIITTIQTSISPTAQDLPEEAPAYALRILSWNPSDPDGFSPGTNTPAEIRDRLRALPSHMADTFGRPENPQDVLVLLSAVASLVECCEMSFSSDDPGSAWVGMATWLARLPARFKELVARHDPAVLVVVAHWAALLVNRAESCGCWCVRGLAMTVLLRIAERLPADDDGGVQRLVALTVAA